jgi:hypothetical protein
MSMCHCEEFHDEAIHPDFSWIATVGSASLAMTKQTPRRIY